MNNDTNEAGLTRYGYTKDGNVYLKNSLGQPDRIIGEVKIGEDEALSYFARRFGLLESKVNSMLDALSIAENKGSYLMQILHLKESLYTHNALGPFEDLLQRLEEAEANIKELIESNRVKNFELKKTLLIEAREEFHNEDIRSAIKRMKEIRFSWMTIGALAKDATEDLDAAFQELMDQFQIIRDKYNAEREIEIEIRTQKLQILLETASRLNTYPPEVEHSFFKMRKLEDEWKAVGNVPKTIYAPLFLEFKRIKKTIAKYARKGPGSGGGGRGDQRSGLSAIYIPRNIPPHEEELYANLRHRMDLISEAESLLKMDLRQANEMAKGIQARWKVAGHIPTKFKSEIFNMFNAISDRIFESSYLARVVHTKLPHFRSMPPTEQLEAKIDSMDEIILKEDMNVRVTQAEFEFMTQEERDMDENRSRFSRLNTSIRKLKMKIKLMNEMKRELDRLKNGGSSSYNSGGDGGYRSSGGGYGNRDSGENRPYSSDRPSYNSDRPSYNSDRPSYNSDRPSYNSDRPAYNSDRPAYNSERPYRSDRPNYGDNPSRNPSESGGTSNQQTGGYSDEGNRPESSKPRY